MPLVAVDQVNHSVDANIISSLSSQDGGFGEGQQSRNIGRNCSNVTFNVFSPHNSETINLYADGPCGSSKLSIEHLHIKFIECTCPVGFQPLDREILNVDVIVTQNCLATSLTATQQLNSS